jgi:hypothetical protein
VHFPRSMPMEVQIAFARVGLAVPLKIFTSQCLLVLTMSPLSRRKSVRTLTPETVGASAFWPADRYAIVGCD